jgi:hypothetical protein
LLEPFLLVFSFSMDTPEKSFWSKIVRRGFALNRHAPSFGAWHHDAVGFANLFRRHPFGCRDMKTELV